MKYFLRFFYPVLLLGLVSVSGCSDEDPFKSVSLAGKVGGEDWTMKSGRGELYEFEKIPAFFISTNYPQDSPCDIHYAELGDIVAQLPKEMGVYSLPFTDQKTFIHFITPEGPFHVADRGNVEITSISRTSLSGSMAISFDALNFVEGDFTILLNSCPETN